MRAHCLSKLKQPVICSEWKTKSLDSCLLCCVSNRSTLGGQLFEGENSSLNLISNTACIIIICLHMDISTEIGRLKLIGGDQVLKDLIIKEILNV